MDPIVETAAKSSNFSLETPISNDLASKIDAFSEMVDAKGVDVDSKVTEVISLWTALHKSLHDKSAENFTELFDKLYLHSARLILKGYWYTAITKNNYKDGEGYKNGLLEPLNGIIQDAISAYPATIELCHSLKPLVETSPWGLSYITEILSSKDLRKSSSAVVTLWEQENAVLLKVRIEFLCSAKMLSQAFALAHAGYLKGYWIYDDPNQPPSNIEDSQYNDYTKELYFQFTDIFYLLLCRINLSTKYHDILSIPKAMEVVERLTTDIGKIAPKWKEWKKAHKTIVVAIAEFLTNQNQMQVDANALKSLYSHWIRCTSKSDGDEEIRPIKEVLSRFSLIQTDYAYELANAILENFSSRPDAGIKFVEIYIRALSKDINQLESFDVTENHDSELANSLRQKLAQRYLRMADVFRASDTERSFQMMLTAFSLNPSDRLFERLFETNNNGDEIVSENSVYHKPIELTSALIDDLQTVTMGCRWGSLCWEKDKSQLKCLCRQLIVTGPPKIKAKADLTDLHIDYTNYEPPPLDEPETINDYGFEKGYEPKDLENMFKKIDLDSRKNTAKVGKTVKRKYKKRGRPPLHKFPHQAGSKFINNYRLQQRTVQSPNDRVGSCDQPNVIANLKMRVRLGSRLKKPHKLVTNKKEIGGRCFIAPPDNLIIYSTEFFRRMSSKDFALDGDCGARWKTIINAPSFLAEGEDDSFDSLKEQLMTTIPVEVDFSSYLVDKPIYNNLKLKCNFGKQNLQPVVALQRQIPPDYVHNVASTCAMDRVIESIQESLKMFQHGIENPSKYSPTLLRALLSPSASDDQLTTNSSLNSKIIPQIVQDVHNALPMHDRYSQHMSNVPSTESTCSSTTTTKAEPKSKINEILYNRAWEQIEKRRVVNSQALGLEISNGNVVHPTSQSSKSFAVPSTAADPSLTLSNNFEASPVSSTHPSENVPLSSLQSGQPMRMDGFLMSQALYKLKILQFDNKISAPSLVHSIPSENLTSLSSDEHLKTIEHSATETVVDNEKVFPSDNENAIATTIKSSDIYEEAQEVITNLDSEVFEVAKVMYGDFIHGDFRKESVATLESKSISKNLEPAQINNDENFTSTSTHDQVQPKLLDSSGPRSRRRKTERYALSRSPSPPGKEPKRNVARRKGCVINTPVIVNNNNEATMNNIEVQPVSQLLLYKKMPEIIEASLENQALYHEGSIFLNDQTGWMEPISDEQNLHFEEYEEPSNDPFWETWQDNSLPETEEQIEAEWRKEMPPENACEKELFEVCDNRINSYPCSRQQTHITTNEQYTNIYENPYVSPPSSSSSSIGPSKVPKLKPCHVLLTRSSQKEIIACKANSGESNEMELIAHEENADDENSTFPMEVNNPHNNQFDDGEFNSIDDCLDAIKLQQVQELPWHYPDLKANSEESIEVVSIVEEGNVGAAASKLSIGSDDDADVDDVEQEEYSGESNEVVPIVEEEENDDSKLSIGDDEDTDVDGVENRENLEESNEVVPIVEEDGDDLNFYIEVNNLLNNPCDKDDESDVDVDELEDWPLHNPDGNLYDLDYNSGQAQQQNFSRNEKRVATTDLQKSDDNIKKMRIEADEMLQTQSNIDEQEGEERDSPSKEIEVIELSSDEEGDEAGVEEEGEPESGVNHNLSYILFTDITDFDYDETDPAVSDEEPMDTTELEDLSKNVSSFYADDEEEVNFIRT